MTINRQRACQAKIDGYNAAGADLRGRAVGAANANLASLRAGGLVLQVGRVSHEPPPADASEDFAKGWRLHYALMQQEVCRGQQ